MRPEIALGQLGPPFRHAGVAAHGPLHPLRQSAHQRRHHDMGAVPPDGWQMIRDTWWNWHLARLAAGITGEVRLIAAILTHRG